MLDDFKPVLNILLRFVIIYILLLVGYQFFLNHYSDLGVDPITRFVAREAAFSQKILGYPTLLVDDPKNETLWFYVNKSYISRMVEGCNAVSVMILFLAFVFAFFKGYKTFVFAGIGLVFIHIMNFFRIAGLNWIILNHPKLSHFAHQYLFPAVIYGSVVLLWLVWVKYFALKDSKI